MKLAIVEWGDASTGGGWGSVEELLSTKILEVTSVGWIVRRTKDLIQLTPGVADNGHCLGDVMIPSGMIRKIRYIGKKYDRKENRDSDNGCEECGSGAV